MNSQNEQEHQEKYTWERKSIFNTYNTMLGYYQAQSVLESKRGESLLDMPCGDGYITGILAEHFKKTVALDASNTHLQIAKKTVQNVDFHHSLIENFETKEKFDTITIINGLEVVINPTAILKKAKSLLSDSGIIIVHVPNAHAINRKIATIMGTLESCEELSPFDIEIAGRRGSFTLQTLTECVENAGLEIISKNGIFYKMLSTPQMDWLLSQGPWEEGGFGWGRVGEEKSKDWKAEFCRACYEFGKNHPDDCNIISICAVKK